MKDLLVKKRVDSNLNADAGHANKTVRDVLELHMKNNIIQNNSRWNKITKLFTEPCPLSRKVYTEHYISKLLSVIHQLRIKKTHIQDLKKLKKSKYSSYQLQLKAYNILPHPKFTVNLCTPWNTNWLKMYLPNCTLTSFLVP